MQSSNHPDRLTTAFAEYGAKNPIPDTKPSGAPANFASYREGFPPITRIPKSASGIPPEGLDMNGVLYDLSNAIRWMQAGAKYPFDATFAAAIGGYPSGAEVLGNDGVTIYRSIVDNNQNNPNSNHAGWLVLSNDAGQLAYFAMSTAPRGWLKANGATISRAQYAHLFAAIGINYGAGDGASTFNLPDLRGEFVRGWDDGRGVDAGRGFGEWQQGSPIVSDTEIIQDGWPGTRNVDAHFYEIASSNALDDRAIHSSAESFAVGIRQPKDETPIQWVFGRSRPRNLALLPCIKY